MKLNNKEKELNETETEFEELKEEIRSKISSSMSTMEKKSSMVQL
jgi:hypothetical protein